MEANEDISSEQLAKAKDLSNLIIHSLHALYKSSDLDVYFCLLATLMTQVSFCKAHGISREDAEGSFKILFDQFYSKDKEDGC